MNDNVVMELPPYMNVERVESSFGIGRRVTWRLLENNEIEGSLVGRRWKVKTKSVLAYLKRRRNGVREDGNV